MKIELILVPFDVESEETGMAHSPQALLDLGFEERMREAGFELFGPRTIHCGDATEKVERVIRVARSTARAVARASSRGRLPLVVSGGCLTAVGVVNGLQRMARPFSVIWTDAHGDFNTPETTPSGYWDGMALAAVCGRSLPQLFKAVELNPVSFRRVLHLGGRALDPAEEADFARLHVQLVPPGELEEETARSAIAERFSSSRDLYLHVDCDGLDPAVAPAVNLPESGGIQLDAMTALLELLPTPVAVTIAGLNFERSSQEERERQLETCLAVVRHALAG